MGRMEQIEKIAILLNDCEIGNEEPGYAYAKFLVDHGIGDKDRFEIINPQPYSGADNSGNLIGGSSIKPKQYSPQQEE